MSDHPPCSKVLRPFSLRPEDLLEGDEKQKFERERADAKKRAKEGLPRAPASPPPRFEDEGEPPASVGRASTHSRRSTINDEDPKSTAQLKEEHTILMTVPPPAQENTGN